MYNTLSIRISVNSIIRIVLHELVNKAVKYISFLKYKIAVYEYLGSISKLYSVSLEILKSNKHVVWIPSAWVFICHEIL